MLAVTPPDDVVSACQQKLRQRISDILQGHVEDVTKVAYESEFAALSRVQAGMDVALTWHWKRAISAGAVHPQGSQWFAKVDPLVTEMESHLRRLVAAPAETGRVTAMINADPCGALTSFSDEFKIRSVEQTWHYHFACSDCGTRGQVACTYCNLGGTLPCTVCAGAGGSEFVGYQQRSWITCGGCHGSGTILCYYCNGSQVVACRSCERYGWFTASYTAEIGAKVSKFICAAADDPPEFRSALEALGAGALPAEGSMECAGVSVSGATVSARYRGEIFETLESYRHGETAFQVYAIGRNLFTADMPPFLDDFISPVVAEVMADGSAQALDRARGCRATETIRSAILTSPDVDVEKISAAFHGALSTGLIAKLSAHLRSVYQGCASAVMQRTWVWGTVAINVALLALFSPGSSGIPRALGLPTSSADRLLLGAIIFGAGLAMVWWLAGTLGLQAIRATAADARQKPCQGRLPTIAALATGATAMLALYCFGSH